MKKDTPDGIFPYKGFRAPAQTHYTSIPNEFFDLIPFLDDRELRILLIIMRDTFGWHKPTAAISLAEIARRTGMNDRQVLRGLLGTGNAAMPGDGCVPKGLIDKTETTRRGFRGMKGRNKYTVHIQDTANMVVSQSTASLTVKDATTLTADLDTANMVVSTTKKKEVKESLAVDKSTATAPTGAGANRLLHWGLGEIAVERPGTETGAWNWPASVKIIKRLLLGHEDSLEARLRDLAARWSWAIIEPKAPVPREWLASIALDPKRFFSDTRALTLCGEEIIANKFEVTHLD